jgi:hypothetical protein
MGLSVVRQSMASIAAHKFVFCESDDLVIFNSNGTLDDASRVSLQLRNGNVIILASALGQMAWVLPEISFACVGRIGRAGGIRCMGISKFELVCAHDHRFSAAVLGNYLGIDHLEGRQNGKDGKFPVNAVHTQIVKSE